jgi:hypothetical protein
MASIKIENKAEVPVVAKQLDSSSLEKTIEKLFYSAESGFQSEPKLYRKLIDMGVKVTHKQVNAFLRKQYTNQVNKQYRQPQQHKFSKILGFEPRNIYQIDIMVFDRYEYHNYKYILCCIDVYSRYVQCRAMTNRSMNTIMENFKSIIEKMQNPKNINADGEFDKGAFKKYCKDNDIKLWVSQPDEPNKNVLVERFHRTLAAMIQKWRIATGRYDWNKILPQLQDNYNTSYHSTLKATPTEVFNLEKVNIGELTNNEQHAGGFQIGDKVRVLVKKQIFDKADRLIFSKQIYSIVALDRQKYEVKNVETNQVLKYKFKFYELQKVPIVQKISEKVDDEIEHTKIQKTRKIKRLNRKEGVEPEKNIVRTLRSRKPENQLISDKYGKINWS